MTIYSSLTALVALILASSIAYASGDSLAGRDEAVTCMGCHGAPGLRNAYPTYRVPKLGGQHEQYLISALKSYQAGDRSHPTMQAQAGSLDQAGIDNIAAYFADLKTMSSGELGKGDPIAGEEKAAACIACHGPAGANPIIPEYPVLAGQYPDFLVHALESYKSGKRKNPIMMGLAASLSKQDIRNLAAYFGSQSSNLSTPSNW